MEGHIHVNTNSESFDQELMSTTQAPDLTHPSPLEGCSWAAMIFRRESAGFLPNIA